VIVGSIGGWVADARTASGSFRAFRLVSFAALCLVAAAPRAEEDYSALLSRAVDAIDPNADRDWAYTETMTEEGRTTVARYDPRRLSGERWVLESVDGREPTAEEAREFRDDKRNDEPSDEPRERAEVADLIGPDSLTLIEETDDHWSFSFEPVGDEDDKNFELLEYIGATLRISKRGPYLEQVKLEADEPFRPRPGVKVREFLTLLRFGPAAEGGPIVPLAADVRIRARAFFVIDVDEVAEIAYSEFEHVGSR